MWRSADIPPRLDEHSAHFPVDLDRMQGLCGIDELHRESASVGPFTIRAMDTNHPGGCAAFYISAGGASIVYAPDHEPECGLTRGIPASAARARTQSLVDFVRGVDLLILDTQYTAAEYSHRVGWGHGCLPESVALATKGNVKHIALFHHDPSHDDEQIDQMVAAAKDLARESELVVSGATENEVIMIKPSPSSIAELSTQNAFVTA